MSPRPSWLSPENIKDLEKLQARATDIIYGYENRLSYEQVAICLFAKAGDIFLQ